jgi:flavin reductase (DIM6/NTAB) family NADH-FMN oxidoreductase RutF
MNITSADYPAPVDEFEIAHLTPLNSNIVRAPRVKESPVNLECQMKQIIPIGSGLEQYGLVIGEVVLAHVQDRIISGNAINQSKLTAIGRLAGSMYTHTHEVFSMDRPIYDNV